MRQLRRRCDELAAQLRTYDADWRACMSRAKFDKAETRRLRAELHGRIGGACAALYVLAKENGFADPAALATVRAKLDPRSLFTVEHPQVIPAAIEALEKIGLDAEAKFGSKAAPLAATELGSKRETKAAGTAKVGGAEFELHREVETPDQVAARLKLKIDWIQRIAAWLDPAGQGDRELRDLIWRDGKRVRAPEPDSPPAAAGRARGELEVIRQTAPWAISDAEHDVLLSVFDRIIAGRPSSDLLEMRPAVKRIAERLKDVNRAIGRAAATGANQWEVIEQAVRNELAAGETSITAGLVAPQPAGGRAEATTPAVLRLGVVPSSPTDQADPSLEVQLATLASDYLARLDRLAAWILTKPELAWPYFEGWWIQYPTMAPPGIEASSPVAADELRALGRRWWDAARLLGLIDEAKGDRVWRFGPRVWPRYANLDAVKDELGMVRKIVENTARPLSLAHTEDEPVDLESNRSAAPPLFVRACWRGSFESFERAMTSFYERTGKGLQVGQFGWRFGFDRNPVAAPTHPAKRSSTRAVDRPEDHPEFRRWMIYGGAFDRAKLRTGTPEDPEPSFEGWPYAEMEARESPRGLIVEVFDHAPFRGAMREWLDALFRSLFRDGLEPLQLNTGVAEAIHREPHRDLPSASLDQEVLTWAAAQPVPEVEIGELKVTRNELRAEGIVVDDPRVLPEHREPARRLAAEAATAQALADPANRAALEFYDLRPEDIVPMRSFGQAPMAFRLVRDVKAVLANGDVQLNDGRTLPRKAHEAEVLEAIDARRRLANKLDPAPTRDRDAQAFQSHGGIEWAPDFSWVRKQGSARPSYAFKTERQRTIVRQLVVDWRAAGQGLATSVVAERINAPKEFRMREAFRKGKTGGKKHKAFMTFVIRRAGRWTVDPAAV